MSNGPGVPRGPGKASSPAPENVEVVDTTPAEKAALTKEQKAALFEAYAQKETAVEALELQLEAAKVDKSTAVKAILEGCGKAGPFAFKGKTLKISKRGDNYFFRAQQDNAEEIG